MRSAWDLRIGAVRTSRNLTDTQTNEFNKPNNSVCFRVFFCRLFAIKATGMEVRAGGCGAELRFFLTTKFRLRGVKGTK